MKSLAFLGLTVFLATSGTATEVTPFSPAPSPSATTAPGLADFASPAATTSPSPQTSTTEPPQLHLRESWARLVGKSFGDILLEANRAFDSADYDSAIDINSFALTLQVTKGQAAVATMNRGNAYAAKGDYEHAFRDLNESVTLDPANAGGYLNRALALRKQGDTAGAQKDYAEALRIDPRQWQTLYNRAHDYAEDGDFDAAIADLSKVIELRPQLTVGLVGRSTVFLRTGAVEKALEDCNAALRIDPKSPEAYLARARAYAFKHNYADAEKDIAAALDNKFGRAEILQNSVAWIRATSPEPKLRNSKEAVRLGLAACEATHWKRWQCIDTLAAAYAEAGDFENAKKYQQQVVSSDLSIHDRNKAEQRLHLYEQGKPFRDDGSL